jgi:quercetin dioxygenase-like cupin family protein
VARSTAGLASPPGDRQAAAAKKRQGIDTISEPARDAVSAVRAVWYGPDVVSPASVAARLGGALAAIACCAAAVAGVRVAAAAPDEARSSGSAPAAAQIVRRSDLEGRTAPPSDAPAATREVARGEEASVSFWQIETEMPAHLHRKHEEIIVVQSGSVETTIGDQRVVLGPGDIVLVPRDTVHSGRSVGSDPARGYSVFAPAFDGRDRVPAPATTP